MNHHLPAGISYQLEDLYRSPGMFHTIWRNFVAKLGYNGLLFKNTVLFELNGWNTVWMSRNKCRMISCWLEKVALILWSNYSVKIDLPAGKFHQLATVTTFTWQSVKCTSWQMSKAQTGCLLKKHYILDIRVIMVIWRWVPGSCLLFY